MKERPILFQGAMVRAILDGSKTQTRRVFKQATGLSLSVGIEDEPGVAELSWLWGDGPGYDVHETVKKVPCPYGKPGDRLWVRETWAQNWNQLSDTRMDRSYVYRADGEQRAQDNGTDLPWRPSIHMPRVACRLVLEITGVRVERLQEISEADAIAEGIDRSPSLAKPGDFQWCDYRMPNDPSEWFNNPVRSYQSLWESINGACSWDANPWVWVVEFKRLPR